MRRNAAGVRRFPPVVGNAAGADLMPLGPDIGKFRLVLAERKAWTDRHPLRPQATVKPRESVILRSDAEEPSSPRNAADLHGLRGCYNCKRRRSAVCRLTSLPLRRTGITQCLMRWLMPRIIHGWDCRDIIDPSQHDAKPYMFIQNFYLEDRNEPLISF